MTDPRRHRNSVHGPLEGRCSVNPHVDFHALAPEIVLTATIVVVLVADLIWPRAVTLARRRAIA